MNLFDACFNGEQYDVGVRNQSARTFSSLFYDFLQGV